MLIAEFDFLPNGVEVFEESSLDVLMALMSSTKNARDCSSRKANAHSVDACGRGCVAKQFVTMPAIQVVAVRLPDHAEDVRASTIVGMETLDCTTVSTTMTSFQVIRFDILSIPLVNNKIGPTLNVREAAGSQLH